jgi:hypothetical protein
VLFCSLLMCWRLCFILIVAVEKNMGDIDLSQIIELRTDAMNALPNFKYVEIPISSGLVRQNGIPMESLSDTFMAASHFSKMMF